MGINQKLAFLQKILGLTQTQLAQKLDVSFPTFNSWIRGRSLPHESKQRKILQLYREVTGQKEDFEDALHAKKAFLGHQKKLCSDPLKKIQKRQDILDDLFLSFTYNTNSIEGSTLTLGETSAVLFEGITFRNKDLREHLEAKNHQVAMKFLFQTIRQQNFSEDYISEIHRILMQGILEDAGLYRRHGVRIVGANVPTANYLKVPDLMQKLMKEIALKEKDVIAHVSRIHALFEKIHPFSDGNGRVGRLIMAGMLLKAHFPPAVIEKKEKQRYYKALQKAQLKEDYEALEDLVCESVLNGYKILID